MKSEKVSFIRNLGKAPMRAGARKHGPGGASAPPSAKASVGARALFGFALVKDAPARAASMAHAKPGSAHMLAFTVNHGLVAPGLATAIGSASFAGFMITRSDNHPLFGGIEHLMIFAQPIGGSQSHRRLLFDHDSPRSVDYSVTGSIDRNAPPRDSANGAKPPRIGDNPDPMRAPLNGYVLRFGRNGVVVVEGPKGSYAAAPGAALPGAGRILSIQNRNGRWVVQTENGMIGEAAL